MTDETANATDSASPPAWYWLVAVAVLLFEGAGAYLFANSLTLDPAMLPLDQRAVFEATPQWMTIAWGVAIGAGVLGAIGLLIRRRFAEPMLLISLLAVVVQFSGILLVRELRELTPEDHLIVPVVILLLAYAVWQMAKLAKRRGWLR
jgi:Na+-transporting methylmalonyl-CoA/oxaloacetate decarboxylase gamma subunit